MTAKEDRVFPVLQAWRIRRVLSVALGLVAALAAGAAAGQGNGWGWWVFAGAMLGLVAYNLAGLVRQPWVVRLGASGVDVCYATGRVVHTGWGEIEAHTITPGGRIGALLVRKRPGDMSWVLPIPTRLIGTQATEELLAALKARLPGLEYRVPGGNRPIVN